MKSPVVVLFHQIIHCVLTHHRHLVSKLLRIRRPDVIIARVKVSLPYHPLVFDNTSVLLLKLVQSVNILLDFLVFLFELVVSPLNALIELVTLDNRHFEINSAKLDDVVDLQLMELVFGFELFQKGVD